MKRAYAIGFLVLLTGCEKSNEPSLLDHPLIKAVVAKVTGKEIEMPSMEEAAEGLSDERREEIKERYKSQIDAFRAKRALSTEGEDGTPAIMQANEPQSGEQ